MLIAKEGAEVVVADVLDEARTRHRRCHGPPPVHGRITAHLEGTKEEGLVTSVVNLAVSKFGKLDILVTNAGVFDLARELSLCHT